MRISRSKLRVSPIEVEIAFPDIVLLSEIASRMYGANAGNSANSDVEQDTEGPPTTGVGGSSRGSGSGNGSPAGGSGNDDAGSAENVKLVKKTLAVLTKSPQRRGRRKVQHAMDDMKRLQELIVAQVWMARVHSIRRACVYVYVDADRERGRGRRRRRGPTWTCSCWSSYPSSLKPQRWCCPRRFGHFEQLHAGGFGRPKSPIGWQRPVVSRRHPRHHRQQFFRRRMFARRTNRPREPNEFSHQRLVLHDSGTAAVGRAPRVARQFVGVRYVKTCLGSIHHVSEGAEHIVRHRLLN